MENKQNPIVLENTKLRSQNIKLKVIIQDQAELIESLLKEKSKLTKHIKIEKS